MDIQQMLEIGKLCTEEENTPCTEACPLHIDIRTILKYVRNGNWDSALQLYRKQGVFPELLSHICDAPCRDACIRSGVDGGLELQLLERAICDYARNLTPQKFAVPQKKASIAIVGAGLTGLTAAVQLAGLGYRINLYEKDSRLGGYLWELPEPILPRTVLEAQLDMVTREQNISIHCAWEVHSLTDCSCDAVILATGSREQAYRVAAKGASSNSPDFWVREMENGVFFAGADLCEDRFSPAEAIAAGKQTAQRTDWYLRGMKNEPLSKVRQSGTKLKPDIGDLMPEITIHPAGGSRYTPEEARKEAERCLSCHCLRCVKACELLKKYRSYPKKYLKDVYQSLNLVEKYSESICKRQIYSCNFCSNCQSVCPESIDMGSVYLEARRILYEKGSLPPAFHEFYLNDMRFSNGEAGLTLPAEQGNSYLFFPGCRLGAFLPNTVETVYRFLNDRLQGQVALHLGCCGAPAYWAGRVDLQTETIAAFREKWNTLGRPEVILACPSCAKLLNQYAPEIPRRMLWDLIGSIGLPAPACDLHGLEFAVFDPCSASEDTELKHSVRVLLKNSGAVISPLKETGGCCGYGGLITYTNPELLERIVRRRIGQSEAEYLTYCVNCRDTFLRRGKATRHLLELLFQEKEEDQIPSLSRQRENRRLLSIRLQGLPVPRDSPVPVLADPVVIEKLDRQFILLEQVYRAIMHCEQTGNLMQNEDSNTVLGNYQEGAATYWVEYERLGHQFRVVNAYSHHIELIDCCVD